jgi:hypothetical protein
MDLWEKGIDAAPSVAVLLHTLPGGSLKSQIAINGEEVLPLGGISGRDTVFCNNGGEYTRFTSDEHGLHNPGGIWGLAEIDILALGDSFTQGGCVPSDKGFVALLREQYPATINLGIADAGPLSMLAALRETLIVTRPHVVLWFHHESDLHDLFREKRSELLLRYLEDGFSQRLWSRQSEVDAAIEEYLEIELNRMSVEASTLQRRKLDSLRQKFRGIPTLSALREHLGLTRGRTNRLEPERAALNLPEGDFQLFESVLLAAKSAVLQSDGELYFVYLPAWERYGYEPGASRDYQRVLSLVESLGIQAIDLNKTFQSHDDPLSLFPFRRFGHYTEEGHRLVAHTVRLRLAPPEK